MRDLLTTLRFVIAAEAESPFWAAAHHPVWPTSNWSAVRWMIGRLDGSKAIFGKDPLLLSNAEPFVLGADRQIVTLIYETGHGLDVANFWSRGVRRTFRVEKEEIVEVGLGATEKVGFVDAWIHAPVDQATAVASDVAMSSFAIAQLNAESFSSEIGELWVDACSPRTRRHVVEVVFEIGEPTQRSLFFTVEEGAGTGGFFMTAVAMERPNPSVWQKRETCLDPESTPEKTGPDASSGRCYRDSFSFR